MLLRANWVFTVLMVLNKLLTMSRDYIKHQRDLSIPRAVYHIYNMFGIFELWLQHHINIYKYIYNIYMFVSLVQVCVIYVVEEVALFWGARSINWCGT